MKNSSYFAFYFLKLGAVLFFFLGLALLHAIFFPKTTIVQGISADLPLGEAATIFALVIVSLAVSYFMFFRIRVILYDETEIRIVNGSQAVATNWANVHDVSKVFGCVPPMYRMTFKDGTEPAYFIMSMFFYAYAIFWSWDFTGFYKYAQEKISEANRIPPNNTLERTGE